MSILPLTSAGLSVDFFTLSLDVEELRYVFNSETGVDEEVVMPCRKIEAAIDAGNANKLGMVFGQGHVSAGDIGIYTKETLLISDIHETDGNHEQSFVHFGGLVYRVVELAPWSDHVGKNVYLGKRHVTQDKV